MIYAHELTFTELLSTKTDFPTITGHMVSKQDSPQEQWIQWQRAVKAAFNKDYTLVPQYVMDYFQLTKHRAIPPKEEVIIESKSATKPFTPPPFTWSPSKLASFEICPAKFAAESFYKTVPYQETIHTIWGNKVHKEAELYMKGGDSVDPEALKPVEKFCKLFKAMPGEKFVEFRMGLTSDWKPMIIPATNKPWEWGESCGRMTLDLGILTGEKFIGVDWKSGKIKDDILQMQIYALVLGLLHPTIQHLDMKYIWTKPGEVTGFKTDRKGLLPVFKDVKERVARLREACETETFIQRRNGLCGNWCGNTACPHSGKR